MNYLAAQPAMVARLRDQLPDTLPVRTAIDITQIQAQALASNPEVWVVFHRDLVSDHSRNRTLMQQQFAVVYLAPGNLQDLERDGEALTQITQALAGYDAGIDGLGEFQRVGSMTPQSWPDAGLVAYGMLFGVALDL